MLGLVDALAPSVTDGVAVLESEDDSVAVELGVCEGVPLVDAVGVPVDVPVGVRGALAVVELVAVGVTVAVMEIVEVPLALPPADKVVVGVAVIVDE